MCIREKIEVWVKGVDPFALARDHDDQSLRGNPPQFLDRCAVIEDVLNYVRTDHRVEGLVREGKALDRRFDEFDPVGFQSVGPHEIDAGYPGELILARGRDRLEEIAGAAADIQDRRADRVGCNALNASAGIVGQIMHSGMFPVECLVFLGRQHGGSPAKIGQMIDMATPDKPSG